MAISEELELDISGALDAIESLNEPLTQLGESLTTSLNTAIDAVDIQPLVDQLASLDASGVTTTIDAAVDQVDGTVPVDADTAQIPGAVDEALQALTDLAVPVGADAAEIPADVDFALAALTDLAVTVDADTSSFGGSIDEALLAANSTIAVDADASGVSDSIDAEITSVDATVEVAATVEAEGIDELELDAETATQKVEGIGTASTVAGGLATGNFEAVGSSLSKLVGPVGGVVAGIAGGVGVLVNKGLEAEAVFDRFRSSVGKFRDDVRNVNVGSLNTDIGDLALKLGSTESALVDINTTLFQYQKTAGLSGEQSAEFANNITALAARAVALNPNLGTVEEVAARMQASFAKSGKGAGQFGIDLSKADIEARALANTGKTSVTALTAQEKAFAGSQLAAAKYGGVIEKDVNKGSKNAAIQQRSVTATLNDFLEEAGRPLVAPFLDILKSLIPVVKVVAPIFADLGKTVLPILAQTLKDSAPQIKLFGQLFKELSPLITPLIRVSLAFINPLSTILALFRQFGDLDVGEVLGGIGSALGDLAGTVGSALGDLGGVLVSAGAALIGGLITGITTAVPALFTFFTGLPQRLIGFLGNLLETLAQKGIELLQGLRTGFERGLPIVLEFITSLPGKVLGAIGDLLETLAQKGIDLLQSFRTGFERGLPIVIEFIKSLPSKVVEAIGDLLGTLAQKGIDVLQGFKNGFDRGLPIVIEFMKSVPGKLLNALGDVVGFFGEVGKAIIGGLRKGLEELLPNLLEFIKKKVVGAIKKIPFIGGLIGNSPSPYFTEVGEAIGEGLASGIKDSASLATSALDDMQAALKATTLTGPTLVPATLPVPGISKLPAVAAALPSAAASASTVGFQSSAQAAAQGLGTGIRIDNLIVQTTAPNQTQVGIEVARQLRAESFRAGR